MVSLPACTLPLAWLKRGGDRFRGPNPALPIFQPRPPCLGSIFPHNNCSGEVTERPIVTVSKTVVPAMVPRVQIPPSPLVLLTKPLDFQGFCRFWVPFPALYQTCSISQYSRLLRFWSKRKEKSHTRSGFKMKWCIGGHRSALTLSL